MVMVGNERVFERIAELEAEVVSLRKRLDLLREHRDALIACAIYPEVYRGRYRYALGAHYKGGPFATEAEAAVAVYKVAGIRPAEA